MTTTSYLTEFPDFDDELPVIEGFKDASWCNETCPAMIDEELHLHLFVDYKDPQRSEFPEDRMSGELGRYTLKRLTEDNYVMETMDDVVIDTSDFDQVLAKIEEIRQERARTI